MIKHGHYFEPGRSLPQIVDKLFFNTDEKLTLEMEQKYVVNLEI